MKFWKYHGCGNDFILIHKSDLNHHSPPLLAKRICHRHTGIGADGLIIVQTKPLKMLFYNQDGSEGTMCGNGIRCFARHCYEEKLTNSTRFEVQTLSGSRVIEIISLSPLLIRVDMGIPYFDEEHLQLTIKKYPYLNQKMTIHKQEIILNCVFIGTHHTVIWTDCLEAITSTEIGKLLCHAPLFTNQSNIDFVQVIDSNTFVMKTYERGVGYTNACGTGACAAYIIGKLQGKCCESVDVYFEEGNLHIYQEQDHIILEGSAQMIASGIYREV